LSGEGFRSAAERGDYFVDHFGLVGQQLLEGPGQEVAEPRVGVTECRLTGFHADHSGYNGTGYLSADAFDEAVLHFGRRGDEHVTGGGAHHFTQVVGLYLAADGSHVGIEGAYSNNDRGRKAKTCGPFGAEVTGGLVCGIGGGEEPGGKAFEERVEGGEELIGWKSAEVLCPKGFMAGSAYASPDISGFPAAGQQEGDPVAVLHPGVAGFSNGVIRAKDVQQLGPEPFGGVDATDVPEVICRKAGGVGIDLGGFPDSGMVFPQDEERVRVVAEGGQQAEGSAGFVNGYGCRAGGIDGDGPDAAGGGGSGLGEAAADGLFEAFDIVKRVLAEAVFCRVAV